MLFCAFLQKTGKRKLQTTLLFMLEFRYNVYHNIASEKNHISAHGILCLLQKRERWVSTVSVNRIFGKRLIMDRELPVSVWPEWKFVEKIGEGAFGKVYKAERSEKGKTFYSAVKVITIPSSQSELNSVCSESSDEQSARDYFQNLVEECVQEVSTMEYFRGNSHVVSIEDYKVVEYLDTIGWDIYIRMEYLTSFMEYCSGKQLKEDEVIQLGIDLCKALEYCQMQNIIHRDIKPENIFVSRFGEFKLGDFGIARELDRSMSGLSKKGTFSYMAPEMYRGEAYDSRVDIYSLGIVLYKLMNRNRLPFISMEKQLITYRDKENALSRRMSGEQLPNPADANQAFAEVIVKACSYDRERRYQSPHDLRAALEDLQFLKKHQEQLDLQNSSPAHQKALAQAVERQSVPAKESQQSAPVKKSAQSMRLQKKSVQGDQQQRTGQKKAQGSQPQQSLKKDTQSSQPQPRPVQKTPERRERQPVLRENACRELKEAQRRVPDKQPVKRSRMQAGQNDSKLGPLIAAVVVMAIAVLTIFAILMWLIFGGGRNTIANNQLQQSATVDKEKLEGIFGKIQDQATVIVNSLSDYNWIGSESDGKISYLDDKGQVKKVLIYPSVSGDGYYEEYYYWGGELFFAYIWADHRTIETLKEGEQKVDLYYYEDGELIRWIDENNRCHDNETGNDEYVERGKKYYELAEKYKNELNAEETDG